MTDGKVRAMTQHSTDHTVDHTAAEARAELMGMLSGMTIAWSVSGRTVGFMTGFQSGLEVGGFAIVTTPDGATLLMQVHDLQVSERQAVQVDLDTDGLGAQASGLVRSAQVGLAIRSVTGTGEVVAEVGPDGVCPFTPVGFTEALIEVAPDRYVAQLVLQGLGAAAGLPIGRAGGTDSSVLVKASGFSRHTFLVGQSGSGKTYALGVILERLLVHTELPMIIIDPNSDFVHLGALLPREKVAARGRPPMDEATYAALAGAIGASGAVRVARDGGGDLPLRIHLSDLSVAEQALTLGLDSLRDADEYSAFMDVVDELSARGPYGLDGLLDRLRADDNATSRRLLQRIRNQRVMSWAVWAASDETSLTALLDGQRAVVLDVGSLEGARERSVIALAVLGYLRRRTVRSSVLLVIDEAHNLLSPDADSELQRAVTDYGVWIAGEGRKYGVHMLVSTQRPQKVHRNVLSQCDNLVLMRMNSKADIDELGSVFSHVPRSMIAEAKAFHQGEMLVAGPISATPLRVRTAERWCAEGGADLPTHWASTGALATSVIMAAAVANETTKDGLQ